MRDYQQDFQTYWPRYRDAKNDIVRLAEELTDVCRERLVGQTHLRPIWVSCALVQEIAAAVGRYREARAGLEHEHA